MAFYQGVSPLASGFNLPVLIPQIDEQLTFSGPVPGIGSLLVVTLEMSQIKFGQATRVGLPTKSEDSDD